MKRLLSNLPFVPPENRNSGRNWGRFFRVKNLAIVDAPHQIAGHDMEGRLDARQRHCNRGGRLLYQLGIVGTATAGTALQRQEGSRRRAEDELTG